jgi:hypothetical protein
MKWTREPPEADGYYWFRRDEYDPSPAVAFVRWCDVRIGPDWHPLARLDGEWCGPLVPPGKSESP